MTTSRDMLMAAAGAASPQAIVMASSNSPYILAYKWDSTSGFGIKYSDPTTLPTAGAYGIDFSPAGNAAAVTFNASPYIHAYPWSITSGFGTKYSNPAGYSNIPQQTPACLSFAPAGNAIMIGGSSYPYVDAYVWSYASGFGSKYSNPSSAVAAGGSNGVTFSPNGAVAAISTGNAYYVYAYTWSSTSGFGTQYTNPSSWPSGSGQSVDFSPDGNYIFVTTNSSLDVYPWSNATGFGVKFAQPTTLPAGNAVLGRFSPAGDVIAVTSSSSPYVQAYPWNGSGGFGTKYANPTSAIPGGGFGLAFSSSGNALAVGHGTSPFISAYAWNSSTGFGAKYTNPSSLPSATVQGVCFSKTPAAPSAPTGVTASIASTTSAAVYFTAGKPNGSPITSYTVTSSPGGFTASGASSPVTVTGLTTGTAYTFTVTATNSTGTSPASAASNSVTPYAAAVVMNYGTSPYINAYPWFSPTGFGTKFSNPSTLPPSGPYTNIPDTVAFSPRNDAVAISSGSPPYINAYAWSSAGFGTKYSNPSVIPTIGASGISFSPAADAIVMGGGFSPYISAYQWSSSTGFGTKYSDPATLPTNFVYIAKFSPSGKYIAVTQANTAPLLAIYEWSSSTGFGSKYSIPSLAGQNAVLSTAFTPDENYVFGSADSTAPYVFYCSFTRSSLSSATYINSFPGASSSFSVDVSPSGETVFATNTAASSPIIGAWPWSDLSQNGNVYSVPATSPGGAPYSIKASEDSKSVLVGSSSYPYIQGYPWSTATGYGTKYSNPASLPNDTVRGISFTSLPSAPVITAIQATAASSTSASVNAVVNPKGYPVTNYSVISTPGGLTASGSSLPLTVTGLTAGTTYTFTLTATNSLGSTNSTSNPVTPTTWASAALFNGNTGTITMRSVTRSSGGRFVSVGYDSSNVGYWSTSTNGTTWTTPSLFGTWVSTWVFQAEGVAVSPSGRFVAVGTGATSPTAPFQPRFSTSTDGTTWTSPTAFNGTARTDTMKAIACSSAGRFVAVGQAGAGSWGCFTTSTDGTTWTTPADFPAGTGSVFTPFSIAVNSSGRFVAVGYGYVGSGPRLAFSTSTNGTTWTAPALIGLDGSNYGPKGYLNGIAVNSSGKFVAVGYSDAGNARPIYTTSNSGTSWTQPAIMTTISETNLPLRGIAVNSAGQFMAVGTSGQYAVSNDGVSWMTPSSVETPTVGYYYAVTSTSTDKFLAVGLRYSPSQAPVFTVSS